MASVLLLDSFDPWDHTHPRAKWPIVYDPTRLESSASYGRNGGGLRVGSGGSTLYTTAGQNGGVVAADSGTLEYPTLPFAPASVGFAFKSIDVELVDDIPILAFIDTGTLRIGFGTYYATQVALYYCTDQHIRVVTGEYNSRTYIADLGVACRRNVYHFIEVSFAISHTGSVTAWFDGKQVLGGTYDTQSLATGSASGIRLFFHRTNMSFGSNVRYFYIDDVYVSSGSRLSDLQVECIRPNADGFYAAWTPSTGSDHYAMVDDLTQDDDSTRVTASAAGNQDTYELTSLSNGTGTVHGFMIGVNHKNAAFDIATMSTLFRQSGTDATGTSSQMGTVEYRYQTQGYLTNPVTAASFNVSEINSNIQIGMKRDS